MNNITKKGLIIAGLTSLSIFAVAQVTKNVPNTNNTGTNITNNRRNDMNKPNFERIEELRKKLENGKMSKAEMTELAKLLERKPKGNKGNGEHKFNDENRKKINPARIEELKTKINSGRLTKEESAEIIELLEFKGNRRGPIPGQNNFKQGNTSSNITTK